MVHARNLLMVCINYAIVKLPDTVVECYKLPYMSAQKAELMALIRACNFFEGQIVTI